MEEVTTGETGTVSEVEIEEERSVEAADDVNSISSSSTDDEDDDNDSETSSDEDEGQGPEESLDQKKYKLIMEKCEAIQQVLVNVVSRQNNENNPAIIVGQREADEPNFRSQASMQKSGQGEEAFDGQVGRVRR